MQLIVQLGRFVPSKNRILGATGVYTRIATSYELAAQWGVAGREAHRYEYIIGFRLRKGFLGEAFRLKEIFPDGNGSGYYIVPVDFINRYIIGGPTVIPLP